jgi:hypothetical protein
MTIRIEDQLRRSGSRAVFRGGKNSIKKAKPFASLVTENNVNFSTCIPI